MEQQKLTESHNTREVYKQNKKQIFSLLLIPFALFVVTLMINLPVASGLQSLIEKQVLRNPRCPLAYKEMDLSFFLPGVSFEDLTIPGRCFQNPSKSIQFNDASFKMSFPSFWPIGIKTKLEAKYEDTLINIFPRFTISGHSIQISNTTLSSSFLNQLTPSPNLVTGDFDVKGNIELKSNQIDSAHLLINSNNFFIPPQTISGIMIPSLPLKKFELAANVVKNKLQIKALRIGNNISNIQGEFKGNIQLSKANIAFSRIDLQGKIKISKEIQEALPIIRLLLNGKKKKNGFYFLTLSGTLGAPQPKIVDPQ